MITEETKNVAACVRQIMGMARAWRGNRARDHADL
jgi:hypothetical protein